MTHLLLFWLLAISIACSHTPLAQAFEIPKEISLIINEGSDNWRNKSTHEKTFQIFVVNSTLSVSRLMNSAGMLHNSPETLTLAATLQPDLMHTKNTHDDALNNIYRTCVRRFESGGNPGQVLEYCINRIDENHDKFDNGMARIMHRAQDVLDSTVRQRAVRRRTFSLIAGVAAVACAPMRIVGYWAAGPPFIFLVAELMDHLTIHSESQQVVINSTSRDLTSNIQDAVLAAQRKLNQLVTPNNADETNFKQAEEMRGFINFVNEIISAIQ